MSNEVQTQERGSHSVANWAHLAMRAIEMRIRPSERKLRRIISRAERVNTGTFGRLPLSERTTNSCGLVTDVFKYCLEDEAKRGGNAGWTANTYQLIDIHLAAAGVESPSDPRYDTILVDAFQHGINVAKIDDKRYLVDLSFGQFALPNGKGSRVKNPQSKVAMALMTRGYVPLTNDNLREYLSLTTLNDHDYTTSVTVDVLDKVEPLYANGFDGPRPELHPAIGR